MKTIVVSSNGQIALDDDLLKHLGVRSGQHITFEKLANGRILMKSGRPTGEISDVFGFLRRKDGPSLSIEEISAIGPPTP